MQSVGTANTVPASILFQATINTGELLKGWETTATTSSRGHFEWGKEIFTKAVLDTAERSDRITIPGSS